MVVVVVVVGETIVTCINHTARHQAWSLVLVEKHLSLCPQLLFLLAKDDLCMPCF